MGIPSSVCIFEGQVPDTMVITVVENARGVVSCHVILSMTIWSPWQTKSRWQMGSNGGLHQPNQRECRRRGAPGHDGGSVFPRGFFHCSPEWSPLPISISLCPFPNNQASIVILLSIKLCSFLACPFFLSFALLDPHWIRPAYSRCGTDIISPDSLRFLCSMA
jgi:hypothetical protein